MLVVIRFNDFLRPLKISVHNRCMSRCNSQKAFFPLRESSFTERFDDVTMITNNKDKSTSKYRSKGNSGSQQGRICAFEGPLGALYKFILIYLTSYDLFVITKFIENIIRKLYLTKIKNSFQCRVKNMLIIKNN